MPQIYSVEHGVKKNRFKAWPQEEMFQHTNTMELQAANLALKIFSPSQINQLFYIQLQTDNQAAISYRVSPKSVPVLNLNNSRNA